MQNKVEIEIELQSDLKWEKHIDLITKDVTQRLTLLRWILKTVDTQTLRIAYFSLVCPTMENVSRIWDPKEKKYVKQSAKI